MPIEEEISMEFPPEEDDNWKTTKHRFLSRNEGGQVSGHYLKIDGDSLVANDDGKDEQSIFKLHSHPGTMEDGKLGYLYVLEHIERTYVVINKTDDTVTVKDDLDIYSTEFNNLKKTQNKRPDVLFYKVPSAPGSDEFWFESYLSDKRRILGFDENGQAMNTAQVQPGDKSSLFKLMSVKDY